MREWVGVGGHFHAWGWVALMSCGLKEKFLACAGNRIVVCRLSGRSPATGEHLRFPILIVTGSVAARGDSQTAFGTVVR